MYCHIHTCWYTHHCPSCCHGHWHAPAPTHWCAVCRRYTSTWHNHYVPAPQPIYMRQPEWAVRDQQTINALAGGPRR